MAEIALGWVRIVSADPPLSVTARMGDERPNVEQGYGGWEEVARPRRSPITTYRGSPALHLSLPLLLDRYDDEQVWSAGKTVERQISELERMAQPATKRGEPPIVRVIARGPALPYQGRRWVVNEIYWGDALMNDAGYRTRQALTLGLIEYVEDLHLTERSAAGRRRSKATAKKKNKRGAGAKRVVAHRDARRARSVSSRTATADPDFGAGEDLVSIAARELGDPERWREIAALNGLRDPRAIRPGQVLRLP